MTKIAKKKFIKITKNNSLFNLTSFIDHPVHTYTHTDACEIDEIAV